MEEIQNGCWWQCSAKARALGLPAGFLTFGPAFTNTDLPIEALTLLPSGDCSRGLIGALADNTAALPGLGVGLYLDDPFLNIERIARQFSDWSIAWVTNLPTIAQHDQQFRDDLRDVNFSVENELQTLLTFRAHGFKTLASVSNERQVASMSDYAPDAILVVQSTKDLQISFPSLSARQAQAHRVADALPDSLTDVSVLFQLTSNETARADLAGVLRPTIFRMAGEWSGNMPAGY